MKPSGKALLKPINSTSALMAQTGSSGTQQKMAMG